MAETVPTSLRLPPELAREIDSRAGEGYGEGRPSVIIADLSRYYTMLRDALARIRLDEAEASLICDAMNGCQIEILDGDRPMTPSRARAYLLAEVEDSIKLNGLDDKWSVDARLLLSKLQALSPLECLAVWDACARFWRSPDRPTKEMLREVGLVRDRPAKSTTPKKRRA